MTGLDGYGVELDIYDNADCSDQGGNGNHAGIDLLTVCDTMSGAPVALAESADLYSAVGDIGDGIWRTALVHLENGVVSVTIDGMPAVSHALTGFTPGTSYWFGFGGGTGYLADRQEIRNVLIGFATPHCL